MDRFRIALDKWQASAAAKPQAVLAPSPPSPSGDHRRSLGEAIVYTRTRVATVSGARARESRIIAATGDDRAGAFQVLRAQVLRLCRLHGWRTIGITSVRPGAGKTFSATNLAVAIAREPNQTVLLADLDLRCPRVAQAFGYQATGGLLECITGELGIEDVLFNPGIDRLVVLPGSVGDRRASELLASPQTQDILRELAARYESRLILCDMAPLTVGDDVLVCLPYLNAVILVVESGRTTDADLEQARELLDGVPIAAVVLNKVRHTSTQESYYEPR